MATQIKLRDLTEADLPVLYEQQREPDANRMAAFPARTLSDFMQHWTTNVLANDATKKKAIATDDGVAGYVLSWNQGGKRLVGYWIGRKYWGRGIATDALSEFLVGLKERPLYAFVARHNIASIRVLQKCGFNIMAQDIVFSEPHGHDFEEYLMELS